MTILNPARILRAAAVLTVAGLAFATPALAHKGGSGKSVKATKSAKPTLDLASVTVTPAAAAGAAIAAAGGGDLLELKLEAHKKGSRLKAEVQTPTGAMEVKLGLDGAVLSVRPHRHEAHAPMALPPSGITWTAYGAAAPAGATVYRISMEHQTKKGVDVVKVEYYASNGKKGRVRLALDGTPL